MTREQRDLSLTELEVDLEIMDSSSPELSLQRSSLADAQLLRPSRACECKH